MRCSSSRFGRDPDLAPFVGSSHLGDALLLVPRDGAAQLGFWSPMEREEAASTGLELLTPETLEIGRWAREMPTAESVLARVLAAALQKLPAGSRIALAGHPRRYAPPGLRAAGTEGWRFVDGSSLLRRARKTKSAEEIEMIRVAAGGTVEAMRRSGGAALRRRPMARASYGSRANGCASLACAEIAHVFARHGLEQPEGNLACAGDAGVPHNQGSNDRVVRLSAVLVDLLPRPACSPTAAARLCRRDSREPAARARTVLATLREAHATSAGARLGPQERTCATCTEPPRADASDPTRDDGRLRTASGTVSVRAPRGAELPKKREQRVPSRLATCYPGAGSLRSESRRRLESVWKISSGSARREPRTSTPLPYDSIREPGRSEKTPS